MRTPDQPTPVIPRAVVEYLEEQFPDECPEQTDPTFLYRKQGNLEVVRFARRLYERQQEG